MKKLIAVSSIIVAGLFWGVHVHAAFDPNRLIDDAVFSNSGSMDSGQIDNFLNSFPNSCISPNSGFAARIPNGYSPSTGFTYGNFASAGNVIAQSARVYGINPQVLLTTLQKEQSLVAGAAGYCNNGDEHKYAAAMGYGCPDGGTVYSWSGISLYRRGGVEHTSTGSTCVNNASKAGFSQQVIRAAWLLKFGQQRSQGNINWAVITGSWDNSDDPQSCYGGPMTQGYRQVCPGGPTNFYDGYRTIDGTAVHMNSGATAALYWYTPHFNGNQNFVNIFTSWFGSIYADPYSASQVSQSSYPQLDPGQQTTVFIKFQNVGTTDWYDDQGVAATTGGIPPVHLATARPLNRASSFNQGWMSTSRPTLNFAAVYEADGSTLTTYQHVVHPGQIAKFSFTLTAPSDLPAGVYREFFNPVAEGVGSGAFGDTSTFFDVTVNSKPSIAWQDQSAYPTIYPSGKATSYLRFKNSGNTIFYDESAIGQAPAGTLPMHLATKSPMNRSSSFSSDWPTSNRPALNFAAVYNADGSLTGNQHVVGPGQIMKFSFNLTVPEGYAASTYTEDFEPILEGTGDGGLGSVGGFFNVTVPSSAVITYTALPNPAQLTSNNPGTISLTIKNSGNASLAGTTKLVTSNGTPFKDSSWIDNNTILGSIGSNLLSLQTRTINFTVLAPDFGVWFNKPINISFKDQSNQTIPLSDNMIPTNIAGMSYDSSNFSQSGYPALTYGQTRTVFFMYKNTGNQYWYDSTSLPSAATRNPYAIHLATNDPLNRISGFAKGWPSPSRPAVNFTAVYESDGTTLAGNQHVAQPGQIMKFQFDISPSTSLVPGIYREFFQPIVEGTADGLLPKAWTFIDIGLSTPTYIANQVSQAAYPTLSAGQQTTVFIKFRNNGSAPWYDDSSISQGPSNAHAIHLSTSHSLNRNSAFSSGWPTSSRPALTFAAVYEADGTTLAVDQHVAQPGQIVKFNFTISAPSGLATGSYREFFQPVAEGTADGAFNDVWTSFVVTVQ
jgi:uncharacterized protein YcfL